MPADDFYPPMTYSPVWLILGILLVLAVVGWLVTVAVRTRPPRTVAMPPTPQPPPGWRLAQLRHEALARIDDVVARERAGDLSSRAAHQDISDAVRGFVEESSGLAARTMTLADLNGLGHPELGPVTDVVQRLYPGEFGTRQDGSVAEVAQRAKAVIATWS